MFHCRKAFRMAQRHQRWLYLLRVDEMPSCMINGAAIWWPRMRICWTFKKYYLRKGGQKTLEYISHIMPDTAANHSSRCWRLRSCEANKNTSSAKSRHAILRSWTRQTPFLSWWVCPWNHRIGDETQQSWLSCMVWNTHPIVSYCLSLCNTKHCPNPSD